MEISKQKTILSRGDPVNNPESHIFDYLLIRIVSAIQ